MTDETLIPDGASTPDPQTPTPAALERLRVRVREVILRPRRDLDTLDRALDRQAAEDRGA